MKYTVLISFLLLIPLMGISNKSENMQLYPKDLLGRWRLNNSTIELEFRKSERDPSRLNLICNPHNGNNSTFECIRGSAFQTDTRFPAMVSFMGGGSWQEPIFYYHVLNIHAGEMKLKMITDLTMVYHEDGKRIQEQIHWLTKLAPTKNQKQ